MLLDLAGNVGLLLWGTHMVTTGVLRGYGSSFRRLLSRSLDTPARAFMAGLIVTTLLQSSTAAVLITTSLAASGVMGLAQGLCVMLGANVGTTLVVQLLSFNIGVVAPILVLAGVLCFRRAESSHIKNLGRITIGLGLMLLALNLLIRTLQPFENSGAVGAIIPALVNQPVLSALAAALLTWLCHSSVVVVLLIVSLVKSGALGPAAALTLVIGANFGATIPPFLEATKPSARRLPLGNMLIRAAGCIVALPLVSEIAAQLARIEPDPARIVVNFHTAFNLALAIIFIGPARQLTSLLIRILPDPPASADPATPRYLDDAVLETANVALVNAAREALRMADMIEAMLSGALDVFRTEDRASARKISRMDAVVDRLGFAVRRYLAEISGEEMNEEDTLRSQEIFTLTINLDYVGDVVANMMIEFGAQRIKRGRSLAPEELQAIADMCTKVLDSLKLALAVFVSGDQKTAHQLLERKKLFWGIESQARERYFQQLRESRAENGKADDFYLRVLRDLKRIHSFIAALAYPVLDRAGHMEERLAETPATEPDTRETQDQPQQAEKALTPGR
jgi:phosphate:Na+ symporter